MRAAVTGAVTTGDSATTNAAGVATFCYTGPTAPGVDAISAFADTNNDTTQEAGEPSDTAGKAWTPGAPATLTLEPKAAANTVGTQHCVTATVKDVFGNPVANVRVEFTVTGAVNTSGANSTNTAGQAPFCYIGPPLPGADLISAFADRNRNGSQDPGEPSGAATKAWVLPVSTPLCEVKISDGGRITALNGDKATFGGNAKVTEAGDPSGEQTYQDHGPAQPMTVKSINVLAVVCGVDRTEATLYGRATIDGSGSFFYRIRLKDGGEPGRDVDMYGILLSNGYFSGDKPLEGGNVQIK